MYSIGEKVAFFSFVHFTTNCLGPEIPGLIISLMAGLNHAYDLGILY
jgi:hypothetical protein